ncbi:MAG: hypothetical protein H7334_15320 [Ferruginibacter sp.]|nr:hypothetical protein [Ferruginibacter sp.]
MTTQNYNTQEGLVLDMRKIRDEISSEIKDMTFEQERAYLDKLLNGQELTSVNQQNCIITTKGSAGK